MDPCMVCEYARHLTLEAIEKAMDEHYAEFPDSNRDYWDECCDREMRYCHPCPYEYARQPDSEEG